jgi:hypothetical protein
MHNHGHQRHKCANLPVIGWAWGGLMYSALLPSQKLGRIYIAKGFCDQNIIRITYGIRERAVGKVGKFGITTGYGLDDQGSSSSRSIFCSSCRPDLLNWLWPPPASYPLIIGGSFLGGKAARV